MKRIQRKRTKGFELPPNTVCINRPTKWGNPFKLTPDGYIMCYTTNRGILGPWIYWSYGGDSCLHHIIYLYEQWITGNIKRDYLPQPPDLTELIGVDYLACFCKEGEPCHGDVLIKLVEELKQTT